MIDEKECKALIASNVIRLRTSRGWSQDELAERVGMHRVQLNRIENGHSLPKAAVLFSLADAFGVPADLLRAGGQNS